jgi:hypothetical protein
VPTPVGSQSVVYNGKTYYADKAYISFQYLDAWITCNGQTTQVGTSRSGDIIELNSADVSSLRFPNLGVQYPVNFADFNTPIPQSAYQGISFCYYGECATIGQFSYAPILAVPAAVRALDSAWVNCGLAFDGVYDPPLALGTASVLDSSFGKPSTAQPESVPTTPAPPPNTGTPPPQQHDPPSTSRGVGDFIASVLGMTGGPQPAAATTAPAQGQIPQQGGGVTNVVAVTIGSGSDAQVISFLPAAVSLAPGSPPGSAAAGGNLVVIDGSTLSADGAAATVGGTVYSLGSDGLVASDVGGGAVTVPIPTSAGAGFPQSVPGEISVAPDGRSIVVGGQTVSLGGPAVTIAGTAYSLGPNGLAIATSVGGPAITIPVPQGGTLIPAQTIAGTPIYAQIASQGAVVVVGGQTLSVGGPPVTLPSGAIYSLGPNGLVVFSGGSTQIYPFSPSVLTVAGVSPIVATLAGHPVTGYALSASSGSPTMVIDGKTLSIGGPPVTISGTVLSLGTAGLVVGGSMTLPVSGTSTIPASASAMTSDSSSASSSSVTSASSSSPSSTSQAKAITTSKKSDGEVLRAPLAVFTLTLVFVFAIELIPNPFPLRHIQCLTTFMNVIA